ncbi:hypothetical protein [Lentzea sp. NPDC060358]|uniref:hypothetical protein n=1 Tax=Lentzea sp. NPDC060358 TaxID=3347103 RepID=UPI003649B29A
MNRTARTALYAVSGGALSALFTLAGTNEAEAAPPPPPKPAPSPAHGIEEKKIAQRQRAAAPKPPAPAKPKPKPSPAHGTEEKKIAQRQQAAAPKPPAPAKPKPKPSPAHGTEEKKIAQKQKQTAPATQQARPSPPRPRELPQSLRIAEQAAERQAKSERQFAAQRQPAKTDDVVQRTAAARRDYAASQQGGAPGTGLRRQASQARDEANRLAGVRDRNRSTSLFDQERNRKLAAEADARADALESRVFQDHVKAQLTKNARQNAAGRNVLLGQAPAAPPVSRPGKGLPQSVRLAESGAERQAETERQFRLHRLTSKVDNPVPTDDVLQRTAPARRDYAASQQGGAPGSGLPRQSDQARDEANRLAALRDRNRTAPPAEQERLRRLAAEAEAEAVALESREIVQRNRRERAEAERVQREHQDRLRREAENRNRPPQSVGVCLNGSATFVASAKGGGCLVFDSKGFGYSYQETLGVETGLGLSGSATVQASSATIENLNGPSVVAGASGVVGVGAEGSLGVSTDGSNNWTASAGPAVGGEASVGVGGQVTNAARLGDWTDLLSVLTGPMPFR